jgi:hypothetical protein
MNVAHPFNYPKNARELSRPQPPNNPDAVAAAIGRKQTTNR